MSKGKKTGLYPTVYSTGRMRVSLAERACYAHPKCLDVIAVLLNRHDLVYLLLEL